MVVAVMPAAREPLLSRGQNQPEPAEIYALVIHAIVTWRTERERG
jgi:hypothetical protein